MTQSKQHSLNQLDIFNRPMDKSSDSTAADILLSRKEAANYLGVSPQTLAIWATTKRYGLEMVKIGRLAKYRRSALDAFITRRTVKS